MSVHTQEKTRLWCRNSEQFRFFRCLLPLRTNIGENTLYVVTNSAR